MWSQRAISGLNIFFVRIPCDSPFSRVAWSYMGRAPKGWGGDGVWQPPGEAATAGESKGLAAIPNPVFRAVGDVFEAVSTLYHRLCQLRVCCTVVMLITVMVPAPCWAAFHGTSVTHLSQVHMFARLWPLAQVPVAWSMSRSFCHIQDVEPSREGRSACWRCSEALWKALSYCTSLGHCFKMHLEHFCTAQD